MTTYGLINTCDSSRVPLHSIDVKASIQGLIANVETELLYENYGEDPIEASFIFPIDDSSAVYKFEAVVDNRLIIGECQGKEQARQTYNDAIAAGETAFLMEEDDSTGDVFECKVGNLPPKTAAKVTFTLVTQCKVVDNNVTTFVYPCVLGPRYNLTPADGSNLSDGNNPSTSRGHREKKSKKTTAYTHVEDVPYTFSAVVNYYCTESNRVNKIHVNAPGKFKFSRVSELHAKVVVNNFDLDTDLEVAVHCTEPNKPMMYVEMGDKNKDGLLKNDMAMLQFHPNITEYVKKPNKKGEYIFVIDRSGSMHGDRIKHAAKALKACLELLPDDCYFNIVSFGSIYSSLFSQGLTGRSLKNSKTTMDLAVKHVDGLIADMGGTEMTKPFKWIYDGTCIPNYPKQIIVLTDGAIWGCEMQSFFSLTKSNRKYCRVFTFGIGFGASTSLIRGLARAGNGQCDFIREDMHKMKKQCTVNIIDLPRTVLYMVAYLLNCAMSPAINEVALTVTRPSSIKYIMIPTELPPIFLGESFTTYLILTGKVPAKGSSTMKCELSGKYGEQEVKYMLEIDLKNMVAETFEAKDQPIHRLAGKKQIKDLQDDEEYDGSMKDKILLVSTAANIMSRYTSFVGVDKGTVKKIKGKPLRVDIPIPKLTEHEERMDRAKKTAMPPMAKAAWVGPAPQRYGGAGPNAPQADKYLGGKVPDIPGGLEMDLLKKKKATSSSTEITLTEINTKQDDDDDADDDDDVNNVVNKSVANGNTPENPNRRKRKQKTGSRLTVKKVKRTAKVCESMFGLWKDGYYYYATVVKMADSNIKNRVHKELRFKDGAVKLVHKNEILWAKVLSPGDIVSVHNGRQTYTWAMVLEYTAKSDQFLLALGNGVVSNWNITDIVIPNSTALKMKDRQEFDAEPKRLIKFKGNDGLTKEITTSDLAELSMKGWINEAIVSFWASQILPRKTKNELLSNSFIFPPGFFLTLTDSLQMSEDFLDLPHELQPIIIERQWRSFILRSDKWRGSKCNIAKYLMNGTNITEKEVLIFPMFDEMHWYVIMAEVTKDPLDRTVYRMKFSTMDSYFKTRREYELSVLKRFLSEFYLKQGKKLTFEDGVYQFHVPIQGNEWDCGLCTLQCIDNTYQENLQPKPHLWWFCLEDLIAKRQEIAQSILDLWDQNENCDMN